MSALRMSRVSRGELCLERLEERLLLDVNSPFGSPVFTAVAGEPEVHAVGVGGVFGANGDAYADLIISYDDGATPPAESYVRAMLGEPGGTFQEATVANLQGPIRNIELADLDNDGWVDVISHFETYSGGVPDEGQIDVKLNDGDGTFSSVIPPIHILADSDIDVLDMNGDGNADILVFSPDNTSVDVYLGTGTGAFDSPVTTNFGAGKTIGHHTDDLNGDDVLDIILDYSIGTPLPTGNTIEVHLGQASGAYNTTAAWEDAGNWTHFAVLHELSGDDRLDMLAYRQDSMLHSVDESVVVFRNDGDGTFTQTWFKELTNWYFLVPSVADLDLDGHDDLLIQDGQFYMPGTSTLYVVHNGGNAVFSDAQSIDVEDLLFATVSAGVDVDHDGWPDIVAYIGAFTGGDLTDWGVDFYFNDHSGTFVEPPVFVASSVAPSFPYGMVQDLNGDHLLDVAFYRELRDGDDYVTNDEIYVLMNVGGRSFAAEQLTEFGSHTTMFPLLLDYDADGNVDPLPFYDVQPTDSDTAGGLTFWGGAGDGGFESAAGPHVTAGRIQNNHVPFDFDQDGDLDLLLVGTDPTGLYVALNGGGGPVNVAPQITLIDPAPGPNVKGGDVYTIFWTDSDPDSDALIGLYWDTDTSSANNLPGSQGTAWGTIATGISENDPANSYGWTVNAPVGTTLYLYGTISDGVTTHDDYTATTLRVNVPPSITLDDPAPGVTVNPGDVYTITWTDSDPDDDAQIRLVWDIDTNANNNPPADSGTTWGTIATGISEDDPANSYDWTVDAPAGASYYLRGAIEDAAVSSFDYTASTLHVNAAPTITLNDPTPGTNVSPGGLYTITWTDSDPDSDALIGLYWDTDTNSANDLPGDEGTTWGTIATGISEDDPANSYGWTVDAPVGTTFYLYGTISDGVWADDDYTGTTLHVTEAVNVPPAITLTEIPPGTQRYAGQTYTITWTDSDPDDNAQIALYWDTDTSSANNLPGDEGTTWGTIATSISEDDETDSYDWTVDAPEGASYYLLAVINDGHATDSDVTANTIEVLEGVSPMYATHTYNDGVVVRLYDINPGNGTPSSSTVAWSWAEFVWGQTDVVVDPGYIGDKVINLIMLFGNGSTTAELGIEVAGNTGLGSLIDARTNPQPLGFLASDGYVGTISLGAGMTGVVVEAGQAPTAIYCGDYVRTIIAKGGVNGSLVIDGDLTLLEVLGGDLNGDVTLTGSNVGTVMAIAIGGQGGSINGDIQGNGNVNTVMAIGGSISGGILAPTGRVGTVMAINGSITSPTIYGQTGVNLVEAINGGLASSVISGASLGTVMAIGGSIDLTGGRSISAESTINSLMAINGSILGDGAISPDIYVGNGNLWSLMAVGGGMQNVWVDVNGSGASAGRLSSVYVGSSVSNSRFEAEGLLSSLFALGGFTNNSVQAGSLSVVYVGGTISEDSTDGDTDTIHADAGSYYVIDHLMGFKHITPTAPATFGTLIASVG